MDGLKKKDIQNFANVLKRAAGPIQKPFHMAVRSIGSAFAGLGEQPRSVSDTGNAEAATLSAAWTTLDAALTGLRAAMGTSE